MAAAHHATPSWRTAAVGNQEGNVHIEPTPRHYRLFSTSVQEGDDGVEPLMESKAAYLIWEIGARSPVLAFPREDIRWAAGSTQGLALSEQQQEDHAKGRSLLYDLVQSDGSRIKSVAWTYGQSVRAQKGGPLPAHLVALETSKFASAWEEEEPVLDHVKNPYHRVDAVRTRRHVQVYALTESGGQVLLADNRRTGGEGDTMAIFETGLPTRWYMPANAFAVNGPSQASMHPPPGCSLHAYPAEGLQTICPYKGIARYHSITLPDDGGELTNVAWSYPESIAALDLTGLVCLWTPGNDSLRLIVDGKHVQV